MTSGNGRAVSASLSSDPLAQIAARTTTKAVTATEPRIRRDEGRIRPIKPLGITINA
jgi:hypothetical protein